MIILTSTHRLIRSSVWLSLLPAITLAYTHPATPKAQPIYPASIHPVNPYIMVATLSAGPVWQRSTNNQTFYLADELEKSYRYDLSSTSLAEGEFFIGLQQAILERANVQFGIMLAANSQTRESGKIWDDADPEFDNFNFKYKISRSA